jgi:hypothetical protein
VHLLKKPQSFRPAEQNGAGLPHPELQTLWSIPLEENQTNALRSGTSESNRESVHSMKAVDARREDSAQAERLSV